MALDAGDQFASIISLFFRRIGALHALRVNDDEAGVLCPTIALSQGVHGLDHAIRCLLDR